MSALAKEKIFEELRNYHTHQFPAIKSPEMNNLRTEFGAMEDRIVGMILSTISGRAEFIDFAKELDTFQDKLKRTMPADGNNDETSRNLFASKISQLSEMMALAKESGFKLRPVKVARV